MKTDWGIVSSQAKRSPGSHDGAATCSLAVICALEMTAASTEGMTACPPCTPTCQAMHTPLCLRGSPTRSSPSRVTQGEPTGRPSCCRACDTAGHKTTQHSSTKAKHK
jgi:hypothetical protein